MDKKKVLVVEDDLIVGAYFKACLENKGSLTNIVIEKSQFSLIDYYVI